MLKEIKKLQKNLVLFNISGGQKCGGGIVSNFNLIKFREVDPKGSTLKSMKNHPGSQKEKVQRSNHLQYQVPGYVWKH